MTSVGSGGSVGVVLCPVDGRQHVGLGAVGGGGGGVAHLLERVRHAVLRGHLPREHAVQDVVEAAHLEHRILCII